jgi:hypothetical protein
MRHWLLTHVSSHNFNLWPSKCNGTSCMHFHFQVLSLAMVHFLHSLSHIPPVVVFWREVGTFFDLPKTVEIKWDNHLWCSKTDWSKLQAFHWCTQQWLHSSSFIGPHYNPKWNACLKVKRYDIGEDSSDGENECSISNKCVSSVGGGSWSITSKPDLLKSITKLSFDGVSRQPVLGQSIIGPVLNLHHAALPEWRACKEIWEHPKTLWPDLWQWLWRHSDCYDLQKVQIKLKGRVLVIQLSTRKHRDKIMVTALLWFLLEWWNAWTSQSVS